MDKLFKFQFPNTKSQINYNDQNSNDQNFFSLKQVLYFGYLKLVFIWYLVFVICNFLFKKNLIFIFMLFILWGCATEYNLATKQEETLLYGTEKEIKIGEAMSRQIETQYKIVTDVDVNERVEKILDRITAVCDRKDLVYFIKVLDEDIMNAVSLPGGYIYVFKGIVDHAQTDDQIAGVIAHEVGHITAKHSIKRMQASYGAILAQILSTQANGNISGGVGFALNSLFLEHSQQDEFQADRLSVKYLKKAGYNPQGISEFLVKLQEEQAKEPVQPYSYWRTHPHLPQRIAVVNQEISGKIEFKDYLNLIGNE